jgi:cysteinyl-tRNA synthetase
MSIRYLGERFDIHTGGVDNIFPHHEGEIAQSDSFAGGSVVNTWLHGQHLLADGVKMAKSAHNSFTVSDLEAKNIEPLAFRYLCMTARYGTRLNFTFASLKAAQRALQRLRNRVWEWGLSPNGFKSSEESTTRWKGRFVERLNDNLDMPGALALTWDLARSDLPGRTKMDILFRFDRVLGLGLGDSPIVSAIPGEVSTEVEKRDRLRKWAQQQLTELQGSGSSEACGARAATCNAYKEADTLRDAFLARGYAVQDAPEGTRVRPKSEWERHQESHPEVSSSADVLSLLSEPDAVDVTIGIIANGHVEDVERCVMSALRWVEGRNVEVVAVDNGAVDGTEAWLDEFAAREDRVRVIHADHQLGEASARNIVLKQSLGRTVLMLDTSLEVTGDLYGPIEGLLDDDEVGVAGPYGLRTGDLHHFHESEAQAVKGEVDAMQAYCFAFRRGALAQVGLMRETFRFYRNLDLDYSFQFKDKGYRIVADPNLPVRRHTHRAWSELGEAERDELSRKNFRRFLRRWGGREDLLTKGSAPHGSHGHPHDHHADADHRS